ncbi:MAG: outer membrane beta-barrel family protein, partial [Chitinophagaceae bacterium]
IEYFMKHLLSRLALLLLTLGFFSPAAYSQFGGLGAGKKMPTPGKIYGKIVDDKTGKPLDAVSVVLQTVTGDKREPINAVLTDGNGEFLFSDLALFPKYEVGISALGFEQKSVPAAFNVSALMKGGAAAMKGMQGGGGDMPTIPDNASAMLDLINIDLGNIRINQTAKALEGVTVRASIPTFVLQGEKKIFNVEKNITTEGGTAADVMKNVPGVLVDADNNVTIRNSAPQILLDGRQSPLTLDEIPADAIESVEVITNPSAKYDAEGGVGGVLNIVLKKNRKVGYNGSIRANVDSRGGAGLGGDFNVRSGKFNISLNTHSGLRHNKTFATTDRTDFFQNPNVGTYQNDINNSNGGFVFGRLGLDYFITNRTTLSVGGVKVHGEFSPDDNIDILTDSLYQSGIEQAWGRRSTSGKNMFDMNGVTVGIKHIFPKPGEEWTMDANGNFGKNSNDNVYTATNYSDAGRQNVDGVAQTKTAGSGTNNYFTIQSDYARPFGKKDKLETGVKASIRTLSSSINNYFYNPLSNAYDVIPNPNSDFKNTDAVYAAYGSYSGNIDDNNSYQIGLRAESSQYNGTLSKADTSFDINYPISLFPSLFYSRKLKNDQQLQFSYRRGISRPNFFQLLPFTDFTDPLNIRKGNPELKPEFTNAVELNYMKNFTKINYVLISLYERHSDNLITGFQTLGVNQITGDSAIITSYINANSSDKYGVEITSGWDLKKWWNITADLNIYNATINTGSATMGSSTYLSGFGKLNNQFKFAKKWSAQLSGSYQTKTNLLPDSKNSGYGGHFGPQLTSSAQGYLAATWSVDASIRRTFGKTDAASLSLSMNDIFRTGYSTQHSESNLFVQDYSRLVNPQRVRLSFNWRFGKMDTDLFRRKNIKGMMDGMQDATQGVGGM